MWHFEWFAHELFIGFLSIGSIPKSNFNVSCRNCSHSRSHLSAPLHWGILLLCQWTATNGERWCVVGGCGKWQKCNIMRCARSGIINIHKSIFYGFELWNDPNYIRFDWAYEYTQTQPATDRRDIDSTTWIETERGRDKDRKRESVVCTKNKENYSLKIMQLITKMCFDSILARLYHIAHRRIEYSNQI